MKSEEIKELFARFEAAAVELEGIECWSARELQDLLGYTKWENFEKVIQKAKDACKNAGEEIAYHFPDVRKTIPMPKGAEKEIDDILSKLVEKCWLEIPQHYQKTVLHEYIVMPNHFHGIIQIVGAECFPSINDTPNDVRLEYFPPTVGVENIQPLRRPSTRPQCKSGTLGAIIRRFKIGTTKQLGFSVWQRNYHEHIIRNKQSYEIISKYIINNPKKFENKIKSIKKYEQ